MFAADTHERKKASVCVVTNSDMLWTGRPLLLCFSSVMLTASECLYTNKHQTKKKPLYLFLSNSSKCSYLSHVSETSQ